MDSHQPNLELITAVAESIGQHRSKFVFLGGAVAGLRQLTHINEDPNPSN